ncbi:MAG TPA: class I SAM-dependent methyltransferase [Planctomycetota bacterium]|nr:class I SAM-dependent methyltransferase [Planctomycetota bacterium]
MTRHAILKLRRPFDFGKLARTYDQWYETPAGQAHDRIQKADVLAMLPHPHPGATLLDVGCGTGHWSRFFAECGYKVVGVDVSQEMIRVAQARNPAGIRYRVADARDLPFRDGSFDVIAAIAAIEFIADVHAALREMLRCLRPGGSLIIGVLNRLAPINRDRLAAGKQPYASGRLLASDELQKLLAPYGDVHFCATGGSPGRRVARAGRDRSRHKAVLVARVRK